MTWWTWMILGALLLGVELLALDAQFYLVFLGISAALVGLAGLMGLVMPEWAQWVAFAVLALISMVTFRRSLYLKIRGSADSFPETMAKQEQERHNEADADTTNNSFNGSVTVVDPNAGESSGGGIGVPFLFLLGLVAFMHRRRTISV